MRKSLHGAEVSLEKSFGKLLKPFFVHFVLMPGDLRLESHHVVYNFYLTCNLNQCYVQLIAQLWFFQMSYSAQKVFIFRVILVHIFPHTRITPNADTIHAVLYKVYWSFQVKQIYTIVTYLTLKNVKKWIARN